MSVVAGDTADRVLSRVGRRERQGEQLRRGYHRFEDHPPAAARALLILHLSVACGMT